MSKDAIDITTMKAPPPYVFAKDLARGDTIAVYIPNGTEGTYWNKTVREVKTDGERIGIIFDDGSQMTSRKLQRFRRTPPSTPAA